jgi:hypothetical protein
MLFEIEEDCVVYRCDIFDHFDEFDSPLDYVLRYSGYSSNCKLRVISDFLNFVAFDRDYEVLLLSFYEIGNVCSHFGFTVSVAQYLMEFVEQQLERSRIVKSRIVLSHFPLNFVSNQTLLSIAKRSLIELFVNEEIELISIDDRFRHYSL